MKAGVVLINFGEPGDPDQQSVVSYLERIFLANARLEPASASAAGPRARELAERRAPALMADYRAMGGSPLQAQTAGQAELLDAELRARGHDAVVVTGMQFTDPDVAAAAAAAREAGATSLVGLPLYPLTGPSTTAAALAELQRSVEGHGWRVPVDGVAGWHTHPDYTAIRADGVRAFCDREGIDLHAPDTRLVFSAHGTPLRYIREGSRYDAYAADHARRLAGALDVEAYDLGYQNHASRPGVEWTEPDIETVVRNVSARRVVVVPISFMQEQSETLTDLDRDLRAVAHDAGLEFHRVPVPHADPRFPALLADLVEPFVNGVRPEDRGLGRCRCVPSVRVHCLASRR